MSRYPRLVKDLDQSEYEELLESDKKLQALEDAGVDNWEGYDWCMRDFHEFEGDLDEY